QRSRRERLKGLISSGPYRRRQIVLAEQELSRQQGPLPARPETTTESAERAARRSLRAQIAKLERELSDAFVTAFPMGGIDAPAPVRAQPRMLSFGELEDARDAL